jgi:predicted RND superfamily exporter protein
MTQPPQGPQSLMEERLPESAFSMRFGRLIMRNRFATLMTLLSITLFFSAPLVNALVYNVSGETLPGFERRFRMNTSARSQWPEHPIIHAQDKFAGRFGTASYVAMAIVRKGGDACEPEDLAFPCDIYDPDFLEKVDRITKAVDEAPYVNHYQVRSIASINTRVIRIEPDGSLTAEPVMEDVPFEHEELEGFRRIIHENPGRIRGFLVSNDDRAVRVAAGFITHRLDNAAAYNEVFEHFSRIKAEEEADGTAEVHVSGFPVLVGWTYRHAYEIVLFLLTTIVLLFFLLLAYFRRLHGVAIPMVAGLSTAIWGMGFCAWIGIALDPLILVIPLLITARSISHTIQMAERFFEDYEMEVDARARRIGRELQGEEITDAKVETATTAMAKLMLPGMLGIITDAAGLMVIFITTIQQMRDLASFGSFWVIAIIFNVILLHPIMIAYLPPPHEAKHYTPRFMNALLGGAGALVTGRFKYTVAAVAVGLFGFATYYVLYNSTIGEARPGTPLFWPEHEFNVSTAKISDHFGGVDNFTVFVDGDQKGASSDGSVLQRMEAMQRHMRRYADPGAEISLVSLIRIYWEVNHYGDPKWGFVPDTASAIARIVFQLMRSSTPGALRPFLTDEQEDANVTFFFPDHKGETIRRAVHYAEEFIEDNPMGRLTIRMKRDKGTLLDAVYYMLGPLLPPRHESLVVKKAIVNEEQEIEGYVPKDATPAGRWSKPLQRDPVEENVIATIGLLGGIKKDEIALSSTISELEVRKDVLGKAAEKLSAEFDYRIETIREDADEASEQWYDDDWSVGDIVDYIVGRSEFWIAEEWSDADLGISAHVARYCVNTLDPYCGYELWVQNVKFKDSSWNPQATGSWTRGSEFVMAGGIMGILAAVNEEVERGHVANILLIFLIVFTFVSVSYRSATAGVVIMFSLATGTILSLFYMALRGTGLNINTLPVQSVGVGIGVDYAIYITDRIRQEASWSGDLDEGIRRAIRTTGMAVTFTATTLVGGIGAWIFSNLRFQAEMAQLLSILMVVNMLGAILLVPTWFSILRPGFFAASLRTREEQRTIEAERPAVAESA